MDGASKRSCDATRVFVRIVKVVGVIVHGGRRLRSEGEGTLVTNIKDIPVTSIISSKVLFCKVRVLLRPRVLGVYDL